LIVDRHGTPLAVTLTGGNRHDVTQLLPLLDAVPPIRGARGRPRRKPRRLYADRGYDFDKYRHLLWKRGIKPLITRRGVAHGSGLGKVRWVVERASPGCTSSNGSAPATSDAPISIRACSNWPAASYASAVCGHHPEAISWLR
jgi:transposase